MAKSEQGREEGEISFFINIPRDDALASEEADELSRIVVDAFTRKLKDSRLAPYISVEGYSWERGCLITSIALSAVVVGVLKGVKDYPDLKKGAIEVAKDLNGMTVGLKRWGHARMSVWFYRDRWSSDSDLKKAFRPGEPKER